MDVVIENGATGNLMLAQRAFRNGLFGICQPHARVSLARNNFANNPVAPAVSPKLQCIPVSRQAIMPLRVAELSGSKIATGQPKVQFGEMVVQAGGFLVQIDRSVELSRF